MKKNNLKTKNARRNFLLQLGAVALGTTVIQAVRAEDSGESGLCQKGKTPTQPEGPFYPIHDQLDKNNDLTRVDFKSERAKGQIIYVRGHVTDQNCQPLKNALVEIWQACESGRYDHPQDPNPAPLDENFQYWGQSVTGDDGRYLFKTILPGAYPAGSGWIRPPHIHFKVSRLGSLELITQLYFAGQALNEKDLILQRLPVHEQNKVVVPLIEGDNNFEPEAKIANFDIVLTQV